MVDQSKIQYLTSEGLKRLKAELAELEGPRRADLAKRLREAISQGDLSENADYTAAKEDQGFVEGRIKELQWTLSNYVLIEEGQASGDVIDVGSTVTVRFEDDDEAVYKIVGSSEANPRNGLISNACPLGQALIGQKAGARVTYRAPQGPVVVEIVQVG